MEPTPIATAIGLSLLAFGAGYALALAKASAQPLPKTQEDLVDELMARSDLEAYFDAVEYKQVSYPVAVYGTSEHGLVIVGSESLSDLLSEVMDDGDDEASELYDSVDYFVADEVLDRADIKEIALYVSQHIDGWFPRQLMGAGNN